MNIVGDLKTADKYYVKMEDGSVRWTSNFALAKKYVSSDKYPDWYGKTLYATNEDLTVINNIVTLQSELGSKDFSIIDKETLARDFINQTTRMVKSELEELIKEHGYKDLCELISWYHSSLKAFNTFPREFIAYRDTLYDYLAEMIDVELPKALEKLTTGDLSDLYTKFVNEFPKYKKDKEESE